jgi:hypothetical protein
MKRRKSEFEVNKKDDEGLNMMISVAGQDASKFEDMGQRAPGTPPAPAEGHFEQPRPPVGDVIIDRADRSRSREEDGSKSSILQSPCDSEEIEEVAESLPEWRPSALPGVVDSENESDTPHKSDESSQEALKEQGPHPAEEFLARSGSSLSEWRQRLLDLFDDLDLDGSGSIDRSELRTAFIDVGIPPIDALQTFLAADESNDSDIDRMEWLHLIESCSAGKDAGVFVDFANRLLDAKDKGLFQLAKNKRKSFCIIRHDSGPRMIWDLFMVGLLAYVSVSLPFSFGFGSVAFIESADNVCDMFFLVDIVFNFRTSYTDSDENLVLSGKRIAKHYLKTWFTLDLVSSVPWETVSAGLLPGLKAARVLKIGKIAKVLKLLRIGKALKEIAGSGVLEQIEEILPAKASQTAGKLSSLVLTTVMLCHWLACFMAANDGDCIDAYLGPDQPKATRYLAALYWAMSTLTTVGYGDLIPVSDKERIYAMLAMIIGGSFYGYIIGSMTSVITDLDIDSRAFNDRMEMLDAWLEWHEKIPMLLKRKIRRHFRRQLKDKTSVDDAMILKDLSPELRADAASFVIHIEVSRNPVFRDLPNSALGSLVQVLQIASAKRGELIVSQGDPGIAMYIIVEGQARFMAGHPWIPTEGKAGTSKANERLKNAKQLIEGDSFGEEIIFTLEETYNYTIVANSLVSMYSLSEDSFKTRFKNMPDLHESMLMNFLETRK